jgi:GTP-binding protein
MTHKIEKGRFRGGPRDIETRDCFEDVGPAAAGGAGREILPTYRRSVVPVSTEAASLPLVAIVGRPNVGKSTLFNRITGSRRSIVGDEPGITRDRIYGEYEWAGRNYRLVDTGGIVPDDPELIPTEIFNQAKVALEEADALVMVVDARTELASPDYDLARLLQRGKKPVFLAVNKVEGEGLAAEAENFRRLGIREVFPVSSEHGQGIGELLDAIAEKTKQRVSESASQKIDSESNVRGKKRERIEKLANQQDDEKPIRTHGEFEQRETSVAIIGRPNVGKSTLLNALTGTTRAIVSPIAGTTRDAVDEVVDFEGNQLRFVDTAGIRRKGKTRLMAEKLSVVMARRHLEAADVALVLIDANEGVTASDATIGGYAHESGRSVIIIVNKWDAVTTGRTDGKPPADREIFEKQVRKSLKYLDYAPVIFLSALEGIGRERKGMTRVLREVVSVAKERRKRVSTGQMNRFLERIDFQRAPVPMAKRIRIFYMTQAAVAPPTFVLFTDRNIKLHFAFERFLENQIRNAFGFKGTPIWFKVKARNTGT